MNAARYLGAHCSVSGGLYRAVERIEGLSGTALQIFTRNQRQWKTSPVKEQEAEQFRQALQQWGDYPVFSHDSYLINLASPDREILKKSVQAFAGELKRCALLGIPGLVTHPGAHKGQGLDKGLQAYVRALDEALDLALQQCPESADVEVLLETTSGQGTVLGSTFQELDFIISTSKNSDRLGVCFDTCHVFAAGYDMRTRESYNATMQTLDSTVGLQRVQAVHLNDSSYGLGSRGDRHEHIGKGEMGLEPFRLVLNDPRFYDVPMVIETPKDKAGKWDLANLNLLRGLVR
ncbi:apurinic endonuclease Apn1 [Desulfonatronospira thiodismutans ASO3-1]|uniref:Probable endonuclease 4 n=1 Tax=Desulfonatronospira thiodismutans ASO3-1 TaxID=555779 RepID=D6SPE0_9BACT|nr:deoxyribonuclease IV [Desulfonatronospira thiodismutans]EFI34616.1 apurinic endonuclease Apn1 [Desulfonatronospira thiodismutans ASO3-1]